VIDILGFSTLDFANEYYTKGFSIFPLRPRSKKPLLTSWKPNQKIRADEEQIRKWFSNTQNNLAVLTGKVSRIIVFDCDGDQAKGFFEHVIENIEDEGIQNAFKSTMRIKTGSGNVNTIIGIKPEDFPDDKEIKNLVLWHQKNVEEQNEIRLKAKGGYIVAPPSIHPNGNRYELLNGTSPTVLSKEQICKLITALKQTEKENFPFKRGIANSRTVNTMYAPSEERQLEDEDIDEIVMLLRAHYLKGTRNDFGLYLSGWLRKEGVSIESANRIIELLAQDDEEKHDRLRTLEETYAKKDCNAIKGYSGLLSILTDSFQDEQKACQILNEVRGRFQGIRSQSYEKKEDNDIRLTNPQQLIKLAEGNSELFFKDQYGLANVKIKVSDHTEIMPIQSKKFEYYLSKLYYDSTAKEKVAGSESLNNAIRVLHAKAIFSGEERILNLRVAWAEKDREIHYDLTDPQWRCIRITTMEWEIIKHTNNVLFTRFNQKAQVMPDRNYPLNIFDQYLDLMQIRDASLRILIKVWTVSLLIPDIPHPIDILHGEQGGSKTTFCRCQKRLIDPDKIEINNIPSEKAEFVQQMYHNYLTVYDNIKYVPPWFSDEVCKAVTGSGNSKRTLYTNDDDTIYNYKRPLIVSGILNWLTEPDALDRSLLTEFERIAEEQRKEEDKVEAAFEEMRSKLFGYIVDTIVKALQIKPTIQLSHLPRMADFTVWGEAIARATGCRPMVFVNAYKENIGKQNVEAIESNPLAQAIEKFVDSWYDEEKGINVWEGSTKEGLEQIKEIADLHNIDTNARSWPKATNSFKRRLKPILSNLREGPGIDVVIDRQTTANSKIKKNTSTIRIEKKHPLPPPSPLEENDTQNHDNIGGDILEG
jgi:Bifunctional DNA primase/polymerase, N-terminal